MYILNFRSLEIEEIICYTYFRRSGAWRSLVARLTGGQEVAGSNPVAPTIIFKGIFVVSD